MKSGLSDAEWLARLRLARSDSVGPATFRDLLNHFPSAAEVLEALPALAIKGHRKQPLRIPSQQELERELKALSKLGARILVFGDTEYPALLSQIDPPPPAICVKGDLGLLDQRATAIVGSRNASAVGTKLSGVIARDLGNAGYVIISGLARGIDAAAHRASIETGTIAVLGGGLDIFYPEENRSLQREIGERGLLIAEMPIGTQPRANLFPRRNRLISGLSLGVVVVEAALRSGSLITARYALEQGRDVFAVPGSPLDPRARGSNSLIKQGAILVETADDVISALDQPLSYRLLEPAPIPYLATQEAKPDLTGESRQRILCALGPTPIQKDEIIRQTGLSASEVGVALIELSLANRLRREPGDYFSLLPDFEELQNVPE
tara:strand:- start:76304 stop:77443 length:1140 start_codon:yes stop_codon:yes gene_type:complete